MTLAELRAGFRVECPDVPISVIPDAMINGYFFAADKDFCARTRCIVDQAGWTFTPVAGATNYDLMTITNFFDIDEFPGGGVVYNNKRLEKTSVGELDKEATNWRTRTAGVPKQYFRRGRWLYYDRPIEAVPNPVIIYCVLISNDFLLDADVPMNGLTYLEPYQVGLIFYVEWRAMTKIKKLEEAAIAYKNYVDYAAETKKTLAQSKYGPITLRRADTVSAT
jgi:hypothetical protein